MNDFLQAREKAEIKRDEDKLRNLKDGPYEATAKETKQNPNRDEENAVAENPFVLRRIEPAERFRAVEVAVQLPGKGDIDETLNAADAILDWVFAGIDQG